MQEGILHNGKIYIQWDEYIQNIYQVGNSILQYEKEYIYLYGIPRGGLIPATILSHYLNLPLITHLDIKNNGK